MKRRTFLKISAVTLGATILPTSLSKNKYGAPKIDGSTPESTLINLSEICAKGETVHFSEQDIIKSLEQGKILNITWPAKSINEPEDKILVDNWKGFIAYNGEKIITWDVDERNAKKRKTLHPLIYGCPTINGVAKREHTVPLSRTAVQQHPLWRDNINPQANLIDTLPQPPKGQRYHEIAEAPEVEDLRDIRHFQYQKESEKLAYNILNWQPDILEENPYPKSNNRFLLHMMAKESSLYDKIGPHISRISTRQIRKKTKDGIDKLINQRGSYAGIAQMGVNHRKGRLTGSIASTPFAHCINPWAPAKNRIHRWSGFEVNGVKIDSKEKFLGDWQAQMLATLYTQIVGYEYVDDILSRRKTDREGQPISVSGAFSMVHLLGPEAAKKYFLYGKKSADGNQTNIETYYHKFKGYDEFLYKPDPDLVEEKALQVTPEGQALLDAEHSGIPAHTKPHPPLSPLERIQQEKLNVSSQIRR